MFALRNLSAAQDTPALGAPDAQTLRMQIDDLDERIAQAEQRSGQMQKMLERLRAQRLVRHYPELERSLIAAEQLLDMMRCTRALYEAAYRRMHERALA